MNREYFKECRLMKGYSQYRIARIIGVSDSCVYGWEVHGKYPKAETIIKLCKLLDMDANKLLNLN